MKVLIGILATVLTLSVSYYFAFALPAHNRAVLDFERDKYRASQQERKAKEDEGKALREAADRELQECMLLADLAYSKSLKSNATPNGHGGFSVATANFTVLERQKTQALEECQRQYERKTRSTR